MQKYGRNIIFTKGIERCILIFCQVYSNNCLSSLNPLFSQKRKRYAVGKKIDCFLRFRSLLDSE